MEHFGKSQIDSFRKKVEEFKVKTHDEWVDAILDKIRGLILRAAVNGKHVILINIDGVIQYHDEGYWKSHLVLDRNPLCVDFEFPGIGSQYIQLDRSFIKGAVYGLIKLTFDLDIITLPTELLTESFEHSFGEPNPRPARLEHLRTLISETELEIPEEIVKDQIIYPIQDLRIIVKIPDSEST